MKNRIILSLLFLTTAAAVVYAQSPVKFPGSEAASVGIYIEEIATGKKIALHDADRALTPASILKSVTCATALDLLGSDFRFKTDFLLVGNDPLQGEADLTIVGSADPTMGSREFKTTLSLPDSVKISLLDMGTTTISGEINIDGAVLPDGGGIVPQWEVEDITESYGVGLFPVNWMDNYFESDYIIPSPPDYFKEILTQELVMNGVRVEGSKPLEADSVATDTVLIYSHLSPDLSTIMHSLMLRSDNLMAEATLRALAPGQPRDSALTILRNHWLEKGIDLKNTRLLDGNGLARGNAISPKLMGSILTSMAKSNKASEFVGLFPVAGKEGTVKTLLKGTRLQGKLAVKSGSMSGVHCYAGYRLDASGRPTHTVVVMVNNFFCRRADVKKAIENYLLKILP